MTNENKNQDEQKEVSTEVETIEVVNEKPVVEPVVEIPKVGKKRVSHHLCNAIYAVTEGHCRD